MSLEHDEDEPPCAGQATLQPGTLIVDLATMPKPLDFDALFGRRAPVEIEIGIGSGYFLSRYAKEHPDVNLLGMDKVGSEVYRTNDKCLRIGARNVRLLRCDAPYFLAEFPAEASIHAIHIYYSDPWPKTKHHKRRLWQPSLVPLLERAIRPGGLLYMKTDVTEYFEVIDGVLRAAENLELVDARRLDLEPMEGDHETNFQRKAREKGHPLHYQLWRRR